MDRLVFGWGIWMFRGSPCQGKANGCFVGLAVSIYAIFVSLFFIKVVSSNITLIDRIYFVRTVRSLGDVVAHSAGVISEPEFTEFDLDPEVDKFLVAATDGLWEFITNQETVEFVEGQVGPAQAVDALVTEAGTRWMQEEQVIDDTTVIVANLFGWRSR